MISDELLGRYPRETLRWLRGQLRMSQEVFAEHLDVIPQTVAAWETRRHAIAPRNRERIAPLLAPQLATPEGMAFARAIMSSAAPRAASAASARG